MPGSWIINKKCLIAKCDTTRAQNKLPFTMKQYRQLTASIYPVFGRKEKERREKEMGREGMKERERDKERKR